MSYSLEVLFMSSCHFFWHVTKISFSYFPQDHSLFERLFLFLCFSLTLPRPVKLAYSSIKSLTCKHTGFLTVFHFFCKQLNYMKRKPIKICKREDKKYKISRRSNGRAFFLFHFFLLIYFLFLFFRFFLSFSFRVLCLTFFVFCCVEFFPSARVAFTRGSICSGVPLFFASLM